ncbi:MAG: lysozyme inhibitor LprI family protein [Novosphingobium sp.]|jgi:uncharacterized protein YecT (DUF1311 family)|nr:lysozyme inhibitor LprI family protein [Novosphingobium sp.]
MNNRPPWKSQRGACAAAVAAGLILGGTVSVHAEDAAAIDRDCDGGTTEMVECLSAQAVMWDKRLNAAYKDALEAAQGEQREQLRAAQRLWLQYRDANCLYYGLGEGSIARINGADCVRRMTRSRALELEDGEDESESPA